MSNHFELKVIDNPTEFSEAVKETANGTRNELILGKWAGGILEFAGIVFPGIDANDIFARHHVREQTGREPHFDAYKSYLDQEHAWLGHYNLGGEAEVTTTELPEDLAAAYELRYPQQTEASAAARRHFSRIALEEPDARVGSGHMTAGTRMLLPVRADGPHIVHDIMPINPEAPGEFVKFIVPTRAQDERDQLLAENYQPLDAFVTSQFGYTYDSAPQKETKATSQPVEKLPESSVHFDDEPRHRQYPRRRRSAMYDSSRRLD